MRLTKFGHACVRLEYDDHVVVIDPGAFTDPEAVDGATHVLITHEHADHADPERLRRTDAVIHTIAAVADQAPPDLRERIEVVAPGDTIAELGVEVVGEKHAIIHPDLPHFDNSGYLFDVGGTRIFHPGDALTVPETPVDLLLLPISGPWLKVSECIDYARAVGAPRNLGIHEAVHSEIGVALVGTHLKNLLPETSDYTLLAPGTDATL